jgi:hypothetical protein
MWLSAHRLLATGENVVSVIDPQRLRFVRRTRFAGVVFGGAGVPGGLALLLGQDVNGFAPAKVAVVDSEGRVRTVTIDRISLGYYHSGDTYEDRRPGFAVDPSTHRAFVVGGTDYMIAEVDLRSLRVVYHGGSTRSLAKGVPGPVRTARWLGGGLLAVAGIDGLQREGLRIVDTRDWRTRVADTDSVDLTLGDGVLVGSAPFCCPFEFAVYGLDGTPRYRFQLQGEQLQVRGPYGYVCRSASLTRVIELQTGATLSKTQADNAPVCATLLSGRSSAQ